VFFMPASEAHQLLADLYRDWHQDRWSQHRLPLRQCWRGCLELALIVERFDDCAVAVGAQTFLPNHAVTWLALRDLPPGQCPTDAVRHRRGASLASTTQARLAYGLPVLDFTAQVRDEWDLKYQPIHSLRYGIPQRPDILDARFHGREWAVINRLSRAMTDFAFGIRGNRGRSRRWPWRSCRSVAGRRFDVPPVGAWFPRAYLALEPATVPQRFHGLARSGTQFPLVVPFEDERMLVAATCLARDRARPAPQALWWDVSSCDFCLDADLETFLFPPLPLPAFDHLCWPLPGDVQLRASFGIPHATPAARHAKLRHERSEKSFIMPSRGLSTGRDMAA
jgi:hypothetical protein